MKWRPISELSDEQRNGQLWIFGWPESEESSYKGIETIHLCYIDGEWLDENDSLWANDPIPLSHGYFLSEPLPDLPKPKKMEWRKFEDEMPDSFPVLVLLSKKSSFPGKFHVVEDDKWLQIHRYSERLYCWMPIIPTEDE